MKPDIYLISLGCPRNLVDSEVLTGALQKKGYRVTGKVTPGAIVILNTCGFIEDAKKESIDMLLELAALKRERKIARIVVTGCLSQRYPKELKKEIDEIDAVFGSSTFLEIPHSISDILKGEPISFIEKKPTYLYNHREPRSLITPRHSVYVKIQEGCMNRCSYCVIPVIRGSYRSRKIASVLKEIDSLIKGGAKEINIIGQDTTLYGTDLYGKKTLSKLLKEASKIVKDGWIRLLYTHPEHFTDELIETIRGTPTICKYMDLPVQHISDKILKRMNRKCTKKRIKGLIAKLRKKIPGLALRSSLIVGFPGENEKDFRELEEFVKETKFERLGVFVYSREEGTKAYDFPEQVDPSEKQKRFRQIMILQRKISEGVNRQFQGRTLKMLIDEKKSSSKKGNSLFVARTEYDAPLVDGVVYVETKKKLKKGAFTNVKIKDTLQYDLVGEVNEAT